MIHRTAVALAVVASVMLAGPAAGAQQVQLPNTRADWEAMSPEQQDRVMDFIWERLQSDLAAGTVKVNETRGDDGSGSAVATAAVAAVSVSYNCAVQWTTYAGGDYVRGGGWTDASTTISRITAGFQVLSPYSSGDFLRDGVHQGWWGQDRTNQSHAESYTGWFWTWSWETSNWTTKGWHSARNGTSWLLGPDRYCTVSVLL